MLAQLERFAGPVRAELGVDRLGVGLWLPAEAAAQLAGSAADRQRLRAGLERAGLEVVTLNAFPYASFHAPVVKHRVYRPDWTEDERLEYTLDCARVLADLLPDDAARGSISTLPLAWRTPWSDERHELARAALDRLAAGLAEIERESGRRVRVALEPEPGCIVETAADAAEHLRGIDPDYLGVCLDVCHMATQFEDPAASLAALDGAGLAVVKSQLAAAVHVPDPAAPGVRAALGGFAEDRFLHQVREYAGAAADGGAGSPSGTREDDGGSPAGGGRVLAVDDLPEALDGGLPGAAPWRVHFHVPVHAEPDAPLEGTGAHLRETARALVGGPRALTDHLEVETYTWSVLPERLRPTDDAGLVAGLAAELRWTRDLLVDLGLEAL